MKKTGYPDKLIETNLQSHEADRTVKNICGGMDSANPP